MPCRGEEAAQQLSRAAADSPPLKHSAQPTLPHRPLTGASCPHTRPQRSALDFGDPTGCSRPRVRSESPAPPAPWPQPPPCWLLQPQWPRPQLTEQQQQQQEGAEAPAAPAGTHRLRLLRSPGPGGSQRLSLSPSAPWGSLRAGRRAPAPSCATCTLWGCGDRGGCGVSPVPPLRALHSAPAPLPRSQQGCVHRIPVLGGFSRGCSSMAHRALLQLSPVSLSSHPAPAPQKQPLESPGSGQKLWESLPDFALLLELLQVVLQPHARHFGDREARGKVFIWCFIWEQKFHSRVCERGEWLCTGGRTVPGDRQGPGARFVQQRGRSQIEKQPRASS